ncbi:mechanosensitive ion channel [Roseibacterium sp. SDUM158017]|uniref:mechanosensitive ion channel domain-containing protein n=1 Tax=Roseicyclus salinarum TaxID=3036773 RepID=UPI002414DA9D|nr:mechanosensitive ion channel domain-containing protein [Roseibacterium sp. SDUM158017]MDG4650201.1 mechanosensitive ion channel [Roseibacterium sp. SDUM158017]
MRDYFKNLTALAARLAFILMLALAVPRAALAQETSGPDASAESQATPSDGAPAVDPRAALAEILRDDASREALIEELDRLASQAGAEPAAPPPPVSLTRRIAAATQDTVQGLASGAQAAWTALERAPDALDNFGVREMGILLDAFRDLLLVIVSTIVAFVVLRRAARTVYGRMGRRAQAEGMAGRWLIFAASGLIDAGVVVLAWAIGYGLAATVIGQFGEIAIRQSLYLNAFVAVEMVKVVVRLVISPAAGQLRPLPISDLGARRLYRALNIGISLIGYGLLLLVPIVNANASAAAGNSVASAVIALAAIYLGAVAVRRRQPVAEWLIAQGRTPVTDPQAAAQAEGALVVEDVSADGPRLAEEPRKPGLYAVLARKWHLLALLWLAFVLATGLTQPMQRVVDVLKASGLVGAAVFAAVVLSGILSRAIGKGVRLPQHVNERLPRLEGRLNGFVPQILTGIRIALLIALALFAVDAAGLIGVGGWLTTPAGLGFLGTVVSVVVILGSAFALWLALVSWVEYRLNPDFGTVPTAREQTLLALLRNALTILLLVITLMFALSEIGLDIGPLLASAGVLGLAIGFGAQKLVQDVITGVFIQLENAMNVGDIVTAGPLTGVVEKLTIRSVSLRDLHGVYHLVPFSSVDSVSNYTRDFSNYVVDMGVAYREDVDEAKQAMFDAYDALRDDPEQAPNLMGDLEWFGLDQFADSAVVLRARIKTLPGKQWGVGRAYNEIVKRIFDERGIEIPFPHTTLYFGEDKKGRTQSLHIESDGDGDPA